MRWTLLPFIFLTCATSVWAHIDLDAPEVRYSNRPSEQNKSCPCGAGGGNQTCTNATTSDPRRNFDAVTTFAPGETVTVAWSETVGHTGRFRVAFDDDGADLADFNAHILADIADPVGSATAPSLPTVGRSTSPCPTRPAQIAPCSCCRS